MKSLDLEGRFRALHYQGLELYVIKELEFYVSRVNEIQSEFIVPIYFTVLI